MIVKAKLNFNVSFYDNNIKQNKAREIMLVARFLDLDKKITSSDWTVFIDLINLSNCDNDYESEIRFLFGDKMPENLLKQGMKFDLYHIMHVIGEGIIL